MRRPALLLTLALAAALAPGPADASVRETWTYQAVGGYPETSAPAARTISSAEAQVINEGYRDTLHATVTLGEAPTDTTDASLHLAFGTQSSSGCQVSWDQSWSTFQPGTGANRGDGSTIQVTVPLSVGQENGWSCSRVFLTDPDEFETYDLRAGTLFCCVVSDPPWYPAKVRAHDPVSVPVGVWRTVGLRVSHVDPAVRFIVVKGRTHHGVSVHKVTVGPLHGGPFRLPVRVRLNVDHARDVVIRAEAYAEQRPFSRVPIPVLTLRPQR